MACEVSKSSSGHGHCARWCFLRDDVSPGERVFFAIRLLLMIDKFGRLLWAVGGKINTGNKGGRRERYSGGRELNDA